MKQRRHTEGEERLPQPEHLDLAEKEMHHLVEKLEDRLLHCSDRPEIEGKILAFLNHSNGPSTDGIAAEMRISPEAAKVHLEELENANRIWRQPSHGAEVGWRISLEGQHCIEQRGIERVANDE